MIPRVTVYQPRHDRERRQRQLGRLLDADAAYVTARRQLEAQVERLRRVDAARQNHQQGEPG